MYSKLELRNEMDIPFTVVRLHGVDTLMALLVCSAKSYYLLIANIIYSHYIIYLYNRCSIIDRQKHVCIYVLSWYLLSLV